MSYAVIEFTPGYLPEDDDPPVFDQWAEALNYVLAQREALFEDEWAYETPEHDGEEVGLPVFMLDVGDFDADGFIYFDKRKTHDLGRIVQIVPVEEES